jgi:arabinofuranosyltransferase
VSGVLGTPKFVGSPAAAAGVVGSQPTTHRWADRAALLAPLAVLATGAWMYRHVADDGFINLRVTAQLLAGNGPVFNAGERVEAVTSPLWIGILTVGSILTPLRMEWLAVLLGIGLTLVGMAAAVTASIRLVRLAHPAVAIVPAGALVYAVLPSAWEYSSSGLEGGLDRAWLGLVFAWLVRRAGREADQWVDNRGLALLVGLAPLIRPDFAVFWVAIVVLCITKASGEARARRCITWTVIALLPGAVFEVFRLGYYAALLPNTAYAKEPSAVLPSRGWRYLMDLVGPTWLWLPLAVLGIVGLALLVRDLRPRAKARALVVTFTTAGLLHISYVVLIGGDFMRGRMLLPGLFAILMPIAVVPIRRVTLLGMTAVGAWAVLAATVLRPPALDLASPSNVASPREFMIVLSGDPHPVTTDDYASALLRETIIVGPGVYQDTHRLETASGPLRTPEDRPSVVVVDYAVGLSSYSQPTDVYVLDALGLGDSFTSHLELETRGRAGHEKVLPASWIWARFVEKDSTNPDPSVITVPEILVRGAGTDVEPRTHSQFRSDVDAARAALSCPALRTLDEATRSPLTFGRVVENIGDAFALHELRVPSDPQAAAGALCPDG